MGLLKNKRGMAQLMIFVIVAIVGLGAYGFGQGWFSSSGGGTLSVTEQQSPDGSVTLLGCQVEDTTLSGTLQNKYSPTQSVDLAPSLTLLNGAVQSGLPATVSPGDKVQVLWTNATGYSKIGDEFTVPCKGTYVVTETTDLINNSALTVKLFNEDGDLLTNGAVGTTNSTIGAGGSQVYDFKLTVPSKNGHPDGLVLVEYPSAKHSASDINVNMGGSKTTCPSWYTVSSTAQSTSCFSVGSILDGDSKSGTISVQAKSGQNPAQGDAYIVHYLTKNAYFDDDASEFKIGFEDEDGNQITPVDEVYRFGIN